MAFLPNSIKSNLLIILLLVTLIPFLLLSFYNNPSNDDWQEMLMMLKYGFWGAQKNYYLFVSGRYFDNVVISLNPLAFHIYWAYKLNAFVLLLLLLISIYWLTGKLFENSKISERIGISSLFIFSFIMLMPDVGQEVYWQSGSYTMFLPAILTLFFLGLVASYNTTINKKRIIIISSLLAILIIGLYEVNMIYLDFLVFLYTLFTVTKKQANRYFPLILLAVCILFTLLEITAPGVRARGTLYPNAHNLSYTITESLLWCGKTLAHWLPFMLLIGFLLFSFLFNSNIWKESSNLIFTIPPWLCLISNFFLMFAGMFIFCWSIGTHPPDRILDDISFYFVAGMMYFSLSVIERLKKRYPDFTIAIYYKVAIVAVLLFFTNHNTSIIRTNNLINAYNELISGTASGYNKEMVARNELLLQSKEDSLVIDKIHHIPTILFWGADTATKGLDYDSFCFYYHKKSIKFKK